MLPDPLWLGVGLGVITLAYFVKGASSFGPALISVPLLGMLWSSPRLYVPLIGILNAGANGAVMHLFAHRIRWKLFAHLLGGTVIGTPLGAWVLVALSPETIRLVIGAAVVASVPVLWWVRASHDRRPVGAVSAWVAGIVAGACGGAVAIDGPPYVAYLSAAVPDRDERYATITAVFLAGAIVRLLIYLSMGVLEGDHWLLAIAATPAMLLGLYLGVKAYKKMTDTGFERLVSAVLLISGLALVWRSLV